MVGFQVLIWQRDGHLDTESARSCLQSSFSLLFSKSWDIFIQESEKLALHFLILASVSPFFSRRQRSGVPGSGSSHGDLEAGHSVF